MCFSVLCHFSFLIFQIKADSNCPRTLALSDQPKDCTVTSRRFNNIFLLTSYSFTSAWFIASILSWKNEKPKKEKRKDYSQVSCLCSYIFWWISSIYQVQGSKGLLQQRLSDVIGWDFTHGFFELRKMDNRHRCGICL